MCVCVSVWTKNCCLSCRDDLPYTTLNPNVFSSLRTALENHLKLQEEKSSEKKANGEEGIDGEDQGSGHPPWTSCYDY